MPFVRSRALQEDVAEDEWWGAGQLNLELRRRIPIGVALQYPADIAEVARRKWAAKDEGLIAGHQRIRIDPEEVDEVACQIAITDKIVDDIPGKKNTGQAVACRFVLEYIEATTAGEAVHAGPTGQDIVAEVAEERIAAISAVEPIVAISAVEEVMARSTVECVVATAARNAVVGGIAGHDIVTIPHQGVFEIEVRFPGKVGEASGHVKHIIIIPDGVVDPVEPGATVHEF